MELSEKNSEEIFLAELEKEFLEKLGKDLILIKNAFDEKMNNQIAKIAHDIKGTIGIFGYSEGTELALNLQLTAEDGNWDKIGSAIIKFEEYLRINKLIS